jgi:hypothetical protein
MDAGRIALVTEADQGVGERCDGAARVWETNVFGVLVARRSRHRVLGAGDRAGRRRRLPPCRSLRTISSLAARPTGRTTSRRVWS